MTLHRKINGVWTPITAIFRKSGGSWVEAKRAFRNVNGVWTQYHQKEVVVTAPADTGNVTIQSYFDSDDWADSLVNKRFIIPAGRTFSATSPTNAALYAAGHPSDTWGGLLTVENHGTIRGYAGNNSGVRGGTALYWNALSADGIPSQLINTGDIWGAGGAGGAGGQGGAGKYTTVTNPVDGPHYSGAGTTGSGHYWWQWASSGSVYFDRIVFNGYDSGQIGGSSSGPQSSFVSGVHTYTRGASEGSTYYAVSESHEVDVTTNTTGGAGGAGGAGQGYGNLSGPSAGANGVAGGTNAGTGGKGGTGGSWGASGATGSTGSAGNNGSGSAGAAGGLSGYYIYNTQGVAGSLVVTNTGSLLGSVLNP